MVTLWPWPVYLSASCIQYNFKLRDFLAVASIRTEREREREKEREREREKGFMTTQILKCVRLINAKKT